MFTIPALEVFSLVIGGIGATIIPKFFGQKVALTPKEIEDKKKYKAGLLALKAAVEKDLQELG